MNTNETNAIKFELTDESKALAKKLTIVNLSTGAEYKRPVKVDSTKINKEFELGAL